MTKKESKKNSLVELFRFLCALWVAYFHGFSPILSDKFNGENISTDFFFIITGLFFLKSIEKYLDKPFSEGLKFILWGRTKKFIVPLIIAAASILICNVAFELDFGGFNWPFSFLWFLAVQFALLPIFYWLLKKTKKLYKFNIICVIIICVCMSLFIFDIKQLDRVARSPAMLALGMLISQIPKLKLNLKDKIKSEKFGLAINAICFSIFTIAFVYLAYLPGLAIWKRHLLTCLICPAVLYFATALPVKSKILNFLGNFSIFIYLAQCPILIHYYAGSQNSQEYFPLFCFYILAMYLINKIANHISNKNKASI